jgi:hypothetical protein
LRAVIRKVHRRLAALVPRPVLVEPLLVVRRALREQIVILHRL